MMEYITTGKIVNTRGLKGELKVYSSTDFAALRYKKGKEVLLFNEESGMREKFKVMAYNDFDGFDYLFLQGIDTIEKANQYRGYLVQILKEKAGKLKQGLYYHFDLLNCEVLNQTGESIGFVSEVVDNGAQKLLRIKRNSTTSLIPFIEKFILKVDIENKQITIQEIEGLL